KSTANSAVRYIDLIPNELLLLEGYYSCIIFSGKSEQLKAQAMNDFYKTLESILQNSDAYNRTQTLLSTKKVDLKRVNKILKKHDSVTRLEAYKSVAFEEVAIKDLLQPFKPSEVPKSVQDYLNKKLKMSTEKDEFVSAVDTSKNNYLAGYMPDISLINKNNAADGALVPRYIHTVLELKKPKSASGLADDDKGQQQPSQQVFSAFLSDGIYFYVLTFDRNKYKFQELLTTFSRGIATFHQMVAQRSPHKMTED
ncbi:19220_t:CDS:2, partial [Gigaspora margarita]